MARIEEVSEPSKARKASRTKGPSPPVKYYLVAYNVLSALGWSYVLLCTLIHLFALDTIPQTSPPSLLATLSQKLASIPYFTPAPESSRANATKWVEQFLPPDLIPIVRRAATTYSRVGYQTAIVQSFAILEVVHALLGWVRSPIATTVMQVSSRYYLVWGIAHYFKNAQENPIYASMVLSWSITEVIRYAFYALSLLGTESYILLWLRYTTFYILYPTGASSEAFLISATFPSGSEYSIYDYARTLLFKIWWPGLYVMMAHMVKQRQKVLGKGKIAGPKSKTS